MFDVVKGILAPFLLPLAVVWSILVWIGRFVRFAAGGVWVRRDKDGPKTHGDAEFADVDRLRELGMLDPKGGFLAAHVEEPIPLAWWTRRRKVYTNPESSLVVWGPRGSGKSLLIKANLREMCRARKKDDSIVYDPVGDIHADIAPLATAAGYDVVVIDLVDPSQSIRYEPLVELDATAYGFHTEVMKLCHLIIPGAKDEKPHFTELPRTLLAGAIVYHLTCQPTTTTLDTCLRSIIKPIAELKKLAAQMQRAMPDDPLVQNCVTAIEVIAGPEFSGVITTMTRKFAPFVLPEWREITRPQMVGGVIVDRGFSFRQMFAGHRPTMVFVRAGADGEVTGPNARLLIGNAVNMRKRMMTEARGGKFLRGLLLPVDEARHLGNCEGMMTVQNELRKAGVNMLLCYLSRADVFQIFPHAKTMLSGMAEVFPGNINDPETLEYASKQSGQTTEWGRGRSTNGQGDSESEHEVGVRAILPHEIRLLPDDEWLLIAKGMVGVYKKPWTIKGNHVLY